MLCVWLERVHPYTQASVCQLHMTSDGAEAAVPVLLTFCHFTEWCDGQSSSACICNGHHYHAQHSVKDTCDCLKHDSRHGPLHKLLLAGSSHQDVLAVLCQAGWEAGAFRQAEALDWRGCFSTGLRQLPQLDQASCPAHSGGPCQEDLVGG